MKRRKHRKNSGWGGARENAGRKLIFNQIRKNMNMYLNQTLKILKKEQIHIPSLSFRSLVSYNRFVELIPCALIPLICYLNTRKGEVTGISFIDATKIPICYNARALRNKVFKGFANWGKSSIGWFFGFKLHLIINEKGELLSFKVTPGNVDDRVPVPDLVQELVGKIFGDKGYISSDLFKELFDQGLQLITPIKKNMLSPPAIAGSKTLWLIY
jgi:hypothetical protein